ncbi:GNAT family N-acetyltransferase [Kitasatospora sp. NBC_01250]|uniref:GNAT family N-acetyltransferase n=1 Tax=Kitasatospora sp. NBC_01250 TaxID=2903571 RepID=UPI002E352C50|nr:GNAT family N-acetyltransferase [Kitasatospora sp. NBC_01250]
MTPNMTLTGADGLLLRPWAEQDAPAVLAAAESVDTLAVADRAQAEQWLAAQRQAWERGDRFAFAVLVGDEVLGLSVLKRPDPAAPAAEVGYWTTGAARGRGLAPRALAVLTDWAFAEFPLEQLELFHRLDNAASCRVAQKTGYGLAAVVPPKPPHPTEAHLHLRERGAGGRSPGN